MDSVLCCYAFVKVKQVKYLVMLGGMSVVMIKRNSKPTLSVSERQDTNSISPVPKSNIL